MVPSVNTLHPASLPLFSNNHYILVHYCPLLPEGSGESQIGEAVSARSSHAKSQSRMKNSQFRAGTNLNMDRSFTLSFSLSK